MQHDPYAWPSSSTNKFHNDRYSWNTNINPVPVAPSVSPLRPTAPIPLMQQAPVSSYRSLMPQRAPLPVNTPSALNQSNRRPQRPIMNTPSALNQPNRRNERPFMQDPKSFGYQRTGGHQPGEFRRYGQPPGPIYAPYHQKPPSFLHYDQKFYNRPEPYEGYNNSYEDYDESGGNEEPYGDYYAQSSSGNYHRSRYQRDITYRGGYQKDPETIEEVTCPLCNITCWKESFHLHLEGRTHKKNVANGTTANKEGMTPDKLTCLVCSIICTNKSCYDLHLQGRAHKKHEFQAAINGYLLTPTVSTEPPKVVKTKTLKLMESTVDRCKEGFGKPEGAFDAPRELASASGTKEISLTVITPSGATSKLVYRPSNLPPSPPPVNATSVIAAPECARPYSIQPLLVPSAEKNNNYKCDFCNIAVPGWQSMQAHMVGARHKKKLEFFIKDQTPQPKPKKKIKLIFDKSGKAKWIEQKKKNFLGPNKPNKQDDPNKHKYSAVPYDMDTWKPILP